MEKIKRVLFFILCPLMGVFMFTILIVTGFLAVLAHSFKFAMIIVYCGLFQGMNFDKERAESIGDFIDTFILAMMDIKYLKGKTDDPSK